MKGLIVGIDPGVKTGIAILDLEGNLVKLHSERDLSEEDVIKILVKEGRVGVIACDVRPAPDFVKRISSKLESTLFTPDKSLKVKKKNSLVKEFLGRIPKNTHKRDALASGLRAYKSYLGRMKKLDEKLKKLGVENEEKFKIYSLRHPEKNVLKFIEKEV